MGEQVRFTCRIEKSEDEQRRFWGRAYIHDTGGQQVTDWSGDVVDTPEAQAALEDAFYGFVKSYRTGDANHEIFDAATMIEGFVVTKDKKTAGLFPAEMDEGIYVGFEADRTDDGDVLWDGVKTGEFKELSVVGFAEAEDA